MRPPGSDTSAACQCRVMPPSATGASETAPTGVGRRGHRLRRKADRDGAAVDRPHRQPPRHRRVRGNRDDRRQPLALAQHLPAVAPPLLQREDKLDRRFGGHHLQAARRGRRQRHVLHAAAGQLHGAIGGQGGRGLVHRQKQRDVRAWRRRFGGGLVGVDRIVLAGIVLTRLVLIAHILVRAPLALVRIVLGCLVTAGGRGRRRQRRQRQPVSPGG